MSVQADVGADFFCTLFEVVDPAASQPILEARNSFSIQIKTTKDPLNTVEMTRNLAYLQRLELPFFVGNVTLSDGKLDIFSAEFLPLMLAEEGIPDDLTLEPTKDPVSMHQFYTRDDRGVRLLCPYVSALAVGENPTPVRLAISRVCERALKNLASRLKNQHIYEFDDNTFAAMAGPGSWEHFRQNFCLSLGEVFANFARYPGRVSLEEFRIFEALHRELQALRLFCPRVWGTTEILYELAKKAWNEAHPSGA